jgi:hypothetical protein
MNRPSKNLALVHPLALLPCALLAACGGGGATLELSSDHDTIAATGTDFATITAKVRVGGDPVAAGVKVSFETTAGSFSQNEQQDTQEAATGALGLASVKLYSSTSKGSATVTATFTDDSSGQDATSSITITFGSPLPVDGTFRLACEDANIGALRTPIPKIVVKCKLTALTKRGSVISASALTPTFLAEAGALSTSTDSSSGETVVLYQPDSGTSTPLDVSPDTLLGEPSYYDKNGKQRNPRDGLVTLVAIVQGEEAFTDTNGNGQYDDGEAFVDSAEPWVDSNDNDKWDSGEKYIDVNGNGRWDSANGKWDSSTKIMAIFKILWTGALDSSNKTSRLSSTTTTISDGGKLTVTAYALDVNLNPIAAFSGASDNLEWTLSSGSSDATTSATTETLQNTLGFSFDKNASTERKRWKLLSNSFTSPTYKATIEDGNPSDGTTAALSFSLSVKVYSTPGKDTDGGYLTQQTESISSALQGTCD